MQAQFILKHIRVQARPSAVQAVTVNGRGDTHHVEVELDNISQVLFSVLLGWGAVGRACLVQMSSAPMT
jgi:hypothetical protein